MTDRALYVAMSGAKSTWNAQRINANNLANVSTSGFKADREYFSSLMAKGPTYETRVNNNIEQTSVDHTQGGIMQTGRELDLAIQDQGFFAVQLPDGEEVYTRMGNFELDATGTLRTPTGLAVVAENGGVISLPEVQKIDIARDGTITYVSSGITVNGDQLKLAKADDLRELRKRADGLFESTTGQPLRSSVDVSVAQGYLESSNVNAVEALTNMITLARQYEFQIRMMETVETNDRTSSTLLNPLGGA